MRTDIKYHISNCVTSSKCPVSKKAYGIIKSLNKDYDNVGGHWNLNPGEYDFIG